MGMLLAGLEFGAQLFFKLLYQTPSKLKHPVDFPCRVMHM